MLLIPGLIRSPSAESIRIANLQVGAALFAFVAVILIFVVLLGVGAPVLLPLASVAFVLAALLCFMTRFPWQTSMPDTARFSALLALLTPWWEPLARARQQ